MKINKFLMLKKDSKLPKHGVWVQSLVGELRSFMMYSTVVKERKKN